MIRTQGSAKVDQCISNYVPAEGFDVERMKGQSSENEDGQSPEELDQHTEQQ